MKLSTLLKRINKKKSPQGFVLPFTMLIVVIILFVVTGAMALLSKQLYFSKLYKQSQGAYYAADDALACAIDIDDTFVGAGGSGIFPDSSTTNTVLKDGGGNITGYSYLNDVLGYVSTSLQLGDIKCAQASIFDFSITNSKPFRVLPDDYVRHFINTQGNQDIEYGLTSVYTMQMDLGDTTKRCATVTINKTPSFRQIIAQGYADCSFSNGLVERAVVNTTVSQ